MSQEESLWHASPAWRGIVLLAAACLALGLLGAPWRVRNPAPPVSSASYTPSQSSHPGVASTSGATPAPAGPGVSLSGSGLPTAHGGDADKIEAANQSIVTLTPPAPPPPVSQPPRSVLGVVWSSQTERRMPGPGVSGGGLILGYGGWGGRSVGHANRGVTSGKHYWELTFSAQPGESQPQSWTSAGVIGAPSSPDARDLMTPGGRPGSLVLEVGRDKSVRGGDVVMFAVDADNRLAYWGLNGQWRNGVPGQAGGVPLSLVSGEQFVAIGSVAAPKTGSPEGDRWIANFGGTAFRYPVPAGFGPYAMGTTGVALAQAGSTAPVTVVGGTATHPQKGHPDSLIGKAVEGTVTVSGETIPLPEGPWTIVAHFRGNAFQPGDSVLLAQVKGKALRKMVAVHAAKEPRRAGSSTFRSCLRQDVFFQSNDDGRLDAPRCWWVNHTTDAWEQQTLFKAARLELDQRGIQAPSVFMNVGFYRSDAEGFATTFYYFDPGEEGIRSQPFLWGQSEWHKSRIDADPQRAAYARKLVEWGRSWGPIYFASR